MKNLHALRALTSQRIGTHRARERERDMLIVRRWVTVRFVHIIFTKWCVRCADAVCVNHILGNLEKVWFNRIRKSESTRMKCESGKWRTGDRWQGGKYFHVKQQKYNLITPEELAALAESMLTKQSTNYRFFLPLLLLSLHWKCTIGLFIRITIVFSGQTSGSTDFSINSSRCSATGTTK